MCKVSLMCEKKFMFSKRLEGNVAGILQKKSLQRCLKPPRAAICEGLHHLDAAETHLPAAGA